MAKNSEELSLKEEVTMYGIKIRKQPLGPYLNTLKLFKKMPQRLVDEISKKDKNFKLSDLLNLTKLCETIIILLSIAPELTVEFLAELLESDEETIKNKITPTQLIKIIKKFWELNELDDFFTEMKPIIEKITTKIGFSELLQSAKKLE